MNISFEGIGEVIATFLMEENSGVKPGDVVCLTGNGQVGLGSSGDSLCGVAVSIAEDGCAGVQINGLAEVAYSGEAAPAVGWNTLTADGAGGARAAESGSGRAYLVIAVDESKNTAVIRL